MKKFAFICLLVLNATVVVAKISKTTVSAHTRCLVHGKNTRHTARQSRASKQTQNKSSAVIVTGKASYYSPKLVSHLMSNGQPYEPARFTCASCGYPLGTRLRVRLVCREARSRACIVVVSDRGPARKLHRIVDLSERAFSFLTPLSRGLVQVEITPL